MDSQPPLEGPLGLLSIVVVEDLPRPRDGPRRHRTFWNPVLRYLYGSCLIHFLGGTTEFCGKASAPVGRRGKW